MKIVFERRTAMQFEFVSFDSSCDESSKPKSGNLWHHVVNISLEPFRNIFRKIWGNYTAMQFEFDSFMSCCDDSSNPKSLITAWFSLLFFCRSSLHSDLKLRISFGNCRFRSKTILGWSKNVKDIPKLFRHLLVKTVFCSSPKNWSWKCSKIPL